MGEPTVRSTPAEVLEGPPTPSRADDAWHQTLHVGLVIPLQGPAGMFGPSCEASAALAVEEINADSGALGR